MKNKNAESINYFTGKGRENISNLAFSVMSFIMKLMDVFGNYSNKNFKTLGLKKGDLVIDYGCGPARYIVKASKAVGEKGFVYAVDIHPRAIKNVNKKIDDYGLLNVEGILAEGYTCVIRDNSADVVYALDMFHMIEKPNEFLKELARLAKPNGRIIIEDGHQSRNETKFKINKSEAVIIESENRYHVVCRKAGI